MSEVIVKLTSDHIKVKGAEYVQDLVRCKDCKKNPKRSWVSCPMTGSNTRKDNDFCSYGVRKGADDEV